MFYRSTNWCDYLSKEALFGFSIWPWLPFSVEGTGRQTVQLSSFHEQPLTLKHEISQKLCYTFCWTKMLKLTHWVSLFIQECRDSFNAENVVPQGLYPSRFTTAHLLSSSLLTSLLPSWRDLPSHLALSPGWHSLRALHRNGGNVSVFNPKIVRQKEESVCRCPALLFCPRVLPWLSGRAFDFHTSLGGVWATF